MKIGRNQPCTCGSGLKFKKCHGSFPALDPQLACERVERAQAEHLIRQQQQGLGRPIVSFETERHRFVAVKNRLMWSDRWKTFPDFLSEYLRLTLGQEWLKVERAKPSAEQHPILAWLEACRRQQRKVFTKPGEIYSMEITGAAACSLILAYSIYLLAHNVELQDRLVSRLKDARDFQGAYYELLVANTLIRAGFELELEDETSRGGKHCEFAAVSQHTGKRYWVEAKMRGVAGVLGRTAADGTGDANPLNQLIKHLSRALKKPAPDERLVFIDLNTDMGDDIGPSKLPGWFEPAMRKLERHEAIGQAGNKKAYVFVTNLPFHRDLDGRPVVFVGPFGFNIPDFNRAGHYRLSETWRRRQAHADAHRIVESFGKILQIPLTFDGSLASEAFGQGQRIMIGQTYAVEDGKGGSHRVTVTSAVVQEAAKTMTIAGRFEDGSHHIFSHPMSDAELAEYRQHPEAYFGTISHVGGEAKTPFELFQFFLESYANATRESLLAMANGLAGRHGFDHLDDDTLRLTACELLTNRAALQQPSFREQMLVLEEVDLNSSAAGPDTNLASLDPKKPRR